MIVGGLHLSSFVYCNSLVLSVAAVRVTFCCLALHSYLLVLRVNFILSLLSLTCERMTEFWSGLLFLSYWTGL